MTRSAESAPVRRAGQFVWEACLGKDATLPDEHYHGFNPMLLDILRRPPRHALELGCAAGSLAAAMKERFPGVRVTGIETDPQAAAVARTRLDKVIEARVEDVDFAAEGVEPGSIDTFLAGDVLEHLHDPWRTLVGIRPLLAGDAQLAVSLPNVRNLGIHARLHNEGSWRYDTHGLLDITHIRFFALRDAMRMFEETGYACLDVKCNLDPEFARLYEENAAKPSVSLSVGRFKLDNLSAPELQEYCTRQFIFLATPAPRPPRPA